MIPKTPQLPNQAYKDLTDFEKDLLKKLTKYLEQVAKETNSKIGSQYEDSMYWMTRP